VVLRRADYRRLALRLADDVATLESEDAVLDAACQALAPVLWAQRVTWSTHDAETPVPSQVAVQTREGRQDATVHVPTAAAPSYVIDVARLAGGRLLLSDDLRMLEDVAHAVAHRIDAIRFTRERVARTVREQEILQLATEAELKALRAQLNPHFLFNTLTTIGYLMREAPDRALDTLYRLTGLLRAVLKRSDGEFATLAQELEIVRSYLAIERARFEERLTTTIDVPRELEGQRIPPLVLQPLVENAVKHGIAPHASGGHVIVCARVEPGEHGDVLCLSVVDTGVGAMPGEIARRRAHGIGLTNIERRLDRYYGPAASLAVRSAPGVGTTVEVRLPAEAAGGAEGAAGGAGAAGARGARPVAVASRSGG
jgi:signal transduction histidine kinase